MQSVRQCFAFGDHTLVPNLRTTFHSTERLPRLWRGLAASADLLGETWRLNIAEAPHPVNQGSLSIRSVLSKSIL